MRILSSLGVLIALIASVFTPSDASAQVRAFPGAEGFGADATGGRGGHVYHVTSLADTDTQGTLRHALSNNSPAGPRTVVFDVGGYIHINSKLGAVRSDLTIAGQTAPGGIGVRGDQTSLGADNLILRHMRFRPGKSAGRVDALSLNDKADNTIVDHCSIQFSYDENGPMVDPANVTLQWSLNAWGLEDHSAGSLLTANGTTVHHTLWAHNHTRNPKARGGLLDWVNNVVFDWDIPYILADTTNEYHWANVIGGCFISGASGQNRAFVSGRTNDQGNPTYGLYLSDTLTDFNTNGVLDGTDKGYGVVSGSVDKPATAYAAAPVAIDDPLTAYKKVLSRAGAWPRDQVDTLLINDVLTQRRRIISRESELGLPDGGFGVLGGGSPPLDSDQDGMSDAWEEAIGLQPGAADNNGDENGNGYTNLEDYLNWLAEPHAQTARNQSIDVGLRQYTSGFGAGASYTLDNRVGGEAELLPDGQTVRFTPTTDFIGLAGFDFTVDDGGVMTQRLGVLVTPLAGPAELVWAGSGASAIWNNLNAENWDDGEGASGFRAGDGVRFDDSAAGTSVQLTETVSPGGVVVDATQDYTFSGGGSLSGGMTLGKFGSGGLRIETANSFLGGASIYDGRVSIVHESGIGGAPVTLAGGELELLGEINLVQDTIVSADSRLIGGGNNTLTRTLIGSGVLEIEIGRLFTFEQSIEGFEGTVRVASGGQLRFNMLSGVWGSDFTHFDAGPMGIITNRLTTSGGEIRLGGLAGGPDSTLQGTEKNEGQGSVDTYVIGARNENTTFAGRIIDTAHTVAIVKMGTGTLTLSGTSDFGGGLRIEQGGVKIDGQADTGGVTVLGGARLAGGGRIGGTVDVGPGGVLDPGGSIGTMTIDGDLELDSESLSTFEVGGEADRLVVNGDLALGGTIQIVAATGIGPGSYRLVDYSGAGPGGSWQLGPSPSGYELTIDATTPGQVNLHLVRRASASYWSKYS